MSTSSEAISLGALTVNLVSCRVYRDGRELYLRPRVFQALQYLLRNHGRLIKYEELIREVWPGSHASRHTVSVTILELKRELREYGQWISIRKNLGYILEAPQSEHLIRAGRHFQNQLSLSGFDKSIRYYMEATQIDSGNARAWQALADSWLRTCLFCILPPAAVREPFLGAYSHAVALNGLTPALRLARALSLFLLDHKLEESESELLEVRRVAPMLPAVHVHLAWVHYLRGARIEAFEDLMQAERLDPFSAALTFSKSRLLLFDNDIGAALNAAKRALDFYPNSPFVYLNLADVLDVAEKPHKAIAQYRIAGILSKGIPWIQAAMATCLARQGRMPAATRILTRLHNNRESRYVDACHMALLFDALDRRDDALRQLQRARSERSPVLFWLDVDPKFEALRKVAR